MAMMTWLQVAAVALPGWLACSALLCLAVSRAVRIRDCNNDVTALADAVRED